MARKRRQTRQRSLAMLAKRHANQKKKGHSEKETKSGTQKVFWTPQDDKKFCEACVDMIQKKQLMQRQGALADERLNKLLHIFVGTRTKESLGRRCHALKDL
ncbi:hypothetical protein GQ55_9G026000 [Panicum hallii var. hallii]|uniref:Uncharacterized protein n=1 Tax=Panicum hallii var. hallii TaxID=1504633 RepID=A0A2T7BYW4_9POAL|nr:hypothetical protein GQ55_9G026000 [Panicum hallii var. hallii]